MNLPLVEKIADAVLYEGYVLYPYRPSSVKNRQRWTFGGIYPRAFAEAQTGADAWQVQTEVLLHGSAATQLEFHARFLHLQERISAGGHWQEAVPREVTVSCTLSEILAASQEKQFDFPALDSIEDDSLQDKIERRQNAIAGSLEIAASYITENTLKITARLVNRTDFQGEAHERDAALMHSLVSAHLIFLAKNGDFVSSQDAPSALQAATTACRNEGLYPVLAGEEGQTDMMLASPIILYDYPQIAPESAGDLFDGTEIDEILTLRILTMTGDEKAEARLNDERARALLDRTEALPPEQMMKLHGVMRSHKT
jgi:hydrogenase maturation protease